MMCSTGRLKVIRYFTEDTIVASGFVVVFIWCSDGIDREKVAVKYIVVL
jgi:hypothetical protein